MAAVCPLITYTLVVFHGRYVVIDTAVPLCYRRAMRSYAPILAATISTALVAQPVTAQDALLLRRGTTLPQGTVMVWESLSFTEFTHMYDNDKGQWASLPGDNRGFSSLTLVGAGLSERFEILLHLPLVHRVSTVDRSTSRAGGLGDISVQTRLNLTHGLRHWPAVALSGLARLPSGDDSSSPTLGDGSTDYGFALVVTKTFGRSAVHLKLGHYINGRAPDETNLGDRMLYMIKADYAVVRSQSRFLRELVIMLGTSGRLDYAGSGPHGTRIANTREYRPLNIVPMLRWTPVAGFFVRPRVVVPVRALAEGGKIGAVTCILDTMLSF